MSIENQVLYFVRFDVKCLHALPCGEKIYIFKSSCSFKDPDGPQTDVELIRDEIDMTISLDFADENLSDAEIEILSWRKVEGWQAFQQIVEFIQNGKPFQL